MAQTGDHRVVAGAGRDRLVAALHEGVRTRDRIVEVLTGDLAEHRGARGQRLILVLDEAFIADDDVVALAGRERAAAQTADDHVVTGACGDVVVADHRVHGIQRRVASAVQVTALDPVAQATGRLVGDATLVAEYGVVAVADRDRVVTQTCDHDVAAVAGAAGAGTYRDRVIAALQEGFRQIQILARHLTQHRRVRGVGLVLVLDEALVGQRDVVAVGDRDSIATQAADHHVVADARVDGVVADHRVQRIQRREPGFVQVAALDAIPQAARRLIRDAALVGQHDVVAADDRDHVMAQTGDDCVVAGAGGDRLDAALHEGVEAARRIVQMLTRDLGEHRGARGQRLILVLDEALIAEDDVVPFAGRECAAAQTADDHVVTGARGDVVVADDGPGRIERRETGAIQVTALDSVGQAAAGLECRRTVVAEYDVVPTDDRDIVISETRDHDVVAETGRDLVVAALHGGLRARPQVRRRHRVEDPGAQLEGDDAVVAEDGVVAVGDRDRVTAEAAGHGVVARSGVDGVIATRDHEA